jgi:hypothetical protein
MSILRARRRNFKEEYPLRTAPLVARVMILITRQLLALLLGMDQRRPMPII